MVRKVYTVLRYSNLSEIKCCVHSIPIYIFFLDFFVQATAVFAADAVARLSGTVGVAAVTAGPGRYYSSLLLHRLKYFIQLLKEFSLKKRMNYMVNHTVNCFRFDKHSDCYKECTDG